jgi:hypothetical protein
LFPKRSAGLLAGKIRSSGPQAHPRATQMRTHPYGSFVLSNIGEENRLFPLKQQSHPPRLFHR